MIIQINENDINEYLNDAKKSGLTFCKKTILYGLFIDNKLKAFTGILLSKNKAVFKNHFVPEKNRGNGYFKVLLDFSIKICKQLNIKVIEATCTKMSINEYYKRGFKEVKKYKYYTKVRNENI